ncbi:MAG: PTPA-CTERM sorting domain-containing protein [Leptolyngbya sp. SIO3F4]|nr:PTPA-CTERM sorting domain-containing protein [Leptolyngbya sp. SIO3F4]
MQGTLLKLGTAFGMTAVTVFVGGSAQALTITGIGGGVPPIGTGGSGTSDDIFQSSINVTDSLVITDLSVSLIDFQHTWLGDLKASLTHEDSGRSVTLFNRPGLSINPTFGDSSDFGGNYTFADGFAPIPENIVPDILPSGTYGPNNSFATFNGLNPFGTWTLTIEDFAISDTGMLGIWQLNIENSETIPTPALLPGLIGMGMAALRKRRQQEQPQID